MSLRSFSQSYVSFLNILLPSFAPLHTTFMGSSYLRQAPPGLLHCRQASCLGTTRASPLVGSKLPPCLTDSSLVPRSSPSYVAGFATTFGGSYGGKLGDWLRQLWGSLRSQPAVFICCCVDIARISRLVPRLLSSNVSRVLRTCTTCVHPRLVPRLVFTQVVLFCCVVASGFASQSPFVPFIMLVCPLLILRSVHTPIIHSTQGACEACRTPQATQWLRHWQAFGLYFSRFYGELAF